MSDPTPKFSVLADANIWISERLLQSTIGGALLYTIISSDSKILLPEIVELEIGTVLPELAERAVANIRRDIGLLKQISGLRISVSVPTVKGVSEGVKERLDQLSGTINRLPFTFEHAKAALGRILQKTPPAGENNEQFRDCCIWQAALETAHHLPVHFLSNDAAFYEGKNRSHGMASVLQREADATRYGIVLHPSIEDFLKSNGSPTKIDEASISKSITTAAMKKLVEIALKDKPTRTAIASEKVGLLKIDGYTTPKSTIIAIAFEVPFTFDEISYDEDKEYREKVKLVLEGVCSYDPNSRDVSDVEIRSWYEHRSLKSGGSSGRSSSISAEEAKR